MSKIGKIPVILADGVTAAVKDRSVVVESNKGTMQFPLPDGIAVTISDGKIVVTQEGPVPNSANFGLTRAMIANMVKGLSTGFDRKLELSGVGYRAQMVGNDLTLSVGFSHPVKIKVPEGVAFAVAENIITVSGFDKSAVGDIAAQIRSIRPPEPYKGKGIKYVGERIRKKAGKAAKAVGVK